jgi:hypothetical protein
MTSSFQDALKAMLAAEFTGEYRDDLAAVTASYSDGQIASYVESLACTHLKVRPARPLFTQKSVGVVFGLELVDDRSVVLKLFAPSLTNTQLSGVLRCLWYLEQGNFPVTPAVSEPFPTPFGQLGCFFSYATGELRTGHEPNVRRELASRLAEFTSIVNHISPADLPPAPGHHTELWLPSHRSYLRFDAQRDATWIHEIAAQAQGVIKASTLRLMPAHMDWGSKNARFLGDTVCAVFDWDSLCKASEAEMVGRAAAQFTAQWDLPASVVPSPSEALAFVEEYERASGKRFSAAEWPVIIASAEYLTATIARLEAAHASPPQYGFLERLRALGETPLFSPSPTPL